MKNSKDMYHAEEKRKTKNWSLELSNLVNQQTKLANLSQNSLGFNVKKLVKMTDKGPSNITSAWILSFSDPPIHYVSMNTKLNGHFLDLPVQFFWWHNIYMDGP